MSDLGWWHAPHLMRAKVFHKRTEPRENAFTYHVYYLALPTAQIATLSQRVLKRERFGLLSFYHADHGTRDGSDSALWAQKLLQCFDLEKYSETMVLVSLPRVLGYVFNPVSFWLSFNASGELTSVIAEVNNTFGETHSYVLAHEGGRAIAADDWFEADKHFHVSPFLKVEGNYRFRFAVTPQSLSVVIDYQNAEGRTELLTSVAGRMQPFSDWAALRAALAIPFVSVKVIALIHYQAIKLLLKRVKYRVKPPPPTTEVTKWRS